MWFVYIVSNANRTLYTGITTDPLKRLRDHIKRVALIESVNPGWNDLDDWDRLFRK